jgi:cytochrome c oxidase assembly protein subunit 11|tara:strand:- start:88 stop:645 length:558 start_codon:yes stop_codon:yes gene_type:complete
MAARTIHRKLLLQLSASAVVMFAFAVFVLPPLYDLFCEVTGIGGKTGGAYEAVAIEVDTSRNIEVQFVAANNATIPWDFYPTEERIVVHPGESRAVTFFARNRTGKDMVAQAIPNVLPNNAADYFHKTECFCFNSQPLAAGEQAELDLVFIIDPDLPVSVNTVTLSYTLFDITDRSEALQVSQVQ